MEPPLIVGTGLFFAAAGAGDRSVAESNATLGAA